jgi:transcriptional regulator with XRE-family HTH domain
MELMKGKTVVDFSWHEVGARIRDMRLARGMSQVQLANQAKLSPPGLFAIEKGDINPQLSSLQSIAKVLECSVRELITGAQSDGNEEVHAALEQVRRVLETGDQLAISTMMGGLAAAQIILASRVSGPKRLRLQSVPESMRGPLERVMQLERSSHPGKKAASGSVRKGLAKRDRR